MNNKILLNVKRIAIEAATGTAETTNNILNNCFTSIRPGNMKFEGKILHKA